MRGMFIVTAVMLGLVGTVVGGMYAAQRSLIYYPSPGPLPGASDVLPGGQDVTLHTGDGLALSAWFFPAKGSVRDAETAPVVLFAQGNGGNRGGRVELARAVTERGISMLLFDYRGYGGNPGSPTEAGLALDVRAAHDYLVTRRGVPRQRLYYFGESLGAGVVSALASEHPPAGMLLRSPFTDLAAVAAVHYPWLPVRLLLKDRYPVADNVAALDDVPVVVVYGTADSIVPPSQSEQVARVAGARRVAVADAGHNDRVLLDGHEVVNALTDLVTSGQR